MSASESSQPRGKSARFWDRISMRYAKSPIADEDTYNKKIELTQQFLSPESRVLEFGCGTGSTALLHAPNVRHILAIDYSPKMIEIASGKLAEADLTNIEFRCATLFDDDFEPGTYDAVLGLNVLHLMPDYEHAIRRAFDLLKPGGVLVTSTACLGDRSWLRLVVPLGARLGLVPEVAFIEKADFDQALVSSGFTIVDELPQKSTVAFHISKKTG